MSEGRKNNGDRVDDLSLAMEFLFAGALPGAVKPLGIVVRQEDMRMGVRRGDSAREYGFIAPGRELALVGEVQIRLTRKDVEAFGDSLDHDFRRLFPEYAHLPVCGVVAGRAIDEDAFHLALDRGFIVLRMEGGEIYPATGKGYRPKKI